ncbi:MAG: histidine phosphatase family protein [Candidatus Dormibacteraeota bacterium]|nr:histidine phosphatase family protein [Candidatus Dormibacteraeota bacterium]
MAERRIVLVRHGETEWSRDGRHTGVTDIPLTEAGRKQAAQLRSPLGGRRFALVLTSPLRRAEETCRLAGFGSQAKPRPDLKEWDYGHYDGLTSAQIRATSPDWSLWRDGGPGGESAADVGRRVDRVIAEAGSADGDVLLFAHGHVLRVLAARWLGQPPEAGRFYALGTAAWSVLGQEHDQPVMEHWNLPPA